MDVVIWEEGNLGVEMRTGQKNRAVFLFEVIIRKNLLIL